jgi:hypothetical protein
MRDPADIRKLEAIYGLLARSFVRYLVDSGGPVVRDERDRRALEALVAWRGADLAILERLDELLAAEKVHPAVATYPVEYSHYHYAGAAYLLGPAIRMMEPHLAALEKEAAGLEKWPEAAAAPRAVEEARSRLDALRALAADRPKDPPKPAPKKGVSASRW